MAENLLKELCFEVLGLQNPFKSVVDNVADN